MKPLTVALALRKAQSRIPRSEARLLLQHTLQVGHAEIVAHPERPLGEGETRRFDELLARRACGEPVAYLLGVQEFYGRPFRVSPAVLIPRPETELIVELARELVCIDARLEALDLGTGSGALAVTLALEFPHARVVALDASADALAIARENARRLGGDLSFVLADWFSALAPNACFDLVISNPPYVAESDPHLGEGDLRFEPRSALVGGGDGLDALRRISDGAFHRLKPRGWLLLEHGYDQAQRVRAMLTAAGLEAVTAWRDLAGVERVTGGRRPG